MKKVHDNEEYANYYISGKTLKEVTEKFHSSTSTVYLKLQQLQDTNLELYKKVKEYMGQTKKRPHIKKLTKPRKKRAKNKIKLINFTELGNSTTKYEFLNWAAHKEINISFADLMEQAIKMGVKIIC